MKKFPLWNNYYLFIMRVSLFTIIMISLSLQMAYPAVGDAQGIIERPVTAKIKAKPLADVINTINLQTHVDFLYTSVISLDRLVNLNAQNEPLRTVLEKLLPPLGLRYQVTGDKILIMKAENPGNADRRVTGQVTDSRGESLPGVTVMVKGTSLVAVTNNDGYYTIKLPVADAVLIFKYIGYTSQEIAVGAQANINVKLLPNSQNLNEVVVTALNFKKDSRSLGYSINTLAGSAVNSVQTPNIINALAGKVPGVNVSNIGNGVAGTKRIVIRGASSLTAITSRCGW